MKKLRLLTGDTPTGRLHLGHYVGSLENRIAMQEDYECFFLLANLHAFTTRVDQGEAIRTSTLDIMLDYLAAGIDPRKSVVFVESEVPAIYELAAIFSMLLPFPRVMRNPTIKDEIRDKGLGDSYSFGFLLYPILQVADILGVRAEIVPVGEDQIPHLEMAREVARKFNQLYCGVDPHLPDSEALTAGGIFPVCEPKLGRMKRLVGLGGPDAEGRLLKMSKSLNNAILLSDEPEDIRKKIMGMYTDPNRLRASDPGQVENNPLWIFHETFNPDTAWVAEAAARYRAGTIGDVECKKKLIEVIVELLRPMQVRRQHYASDPHQVLQLLKQGNEIANAENEKTLQQVKEAMKQVY